MNGLRKCTAVGRCLSQLFCRLCHRLLYPLRVGGIQSEVDLEGAVPRRQPCCFGCLSECKEMAELNEQLEKELSSEVGVCDLVYSEQQSHLGEYSTLHLPPNRAVLGL